ncbi:MAG: arylsulfatase, partial [Zoogloeaceae bacterium]|nr:arylsulfatase [Zoogloeaceae bacterium]
GRIGLTASESRPVKPEIKYPPENAPNVVVVLLDDVGFGSASTFGGPIPTPTLEALAQGGLRYNQFHTTAMCSPTRAALLTGRNHHHVHMGMVGEGASGYPGYDSIIPKSAATLGEVLRQNGYNTGWFGKNHTTPMWELTTAGPFDRWPTGLGFERFYGFHGGQTSQWEPSIVDQFSPKEPFREREDYHLNTDLADQCIHWIRNQKAAAPGKPFFAFFAPGACHAPHQAPKEWIDRFKGQFDQGWDKLREEIHARQLKLGVIPPGTRLTPRPKEIPAWEDYPERYRPVATRLMEAFAGLLAHTDDQIGRVVSSIQELGQWDNTLFIYIVGDNGASGEGTIHGAWNEITAFGFGGGEDPEWLLAHIDDIGTNRCENHYNIAWAWALDAPFQWMKQIASHFGGTRNATVVSWPKGIQEKGGLRSQFHHVIDIFPTVLEVAGIDVPEIVNGTAQDPLDGVSFAYSFNAPEKPGQRKTQYFEMFSNRAIYHDGWVAGCFQGLPWKLGSLKPVSDGVKWELYHVAQDFSQSEDLAEKYPEKLKELQLLFIEEAQKNNVFPLWDASQWPSLPNLTEGRTHFSFYPENIRLNEFSTVDFKNRSFDLTAYLDIPAQGAEGVVICQGGIVGGWSLYVEKNRPVYFYNWYGHAHYRVASDKPLPAGRVELKLVFDYEGGTTGLGKGGLARILVNGEETAQGRIEKTTEFVFSISGEGLDVGRDTGSQVGPYEKGFPFTGKIERVDVDFRSTLDLKALAALLAGQAQAVAQAE